LKIELKLKKFSPFKQLPIIAKFGAILTWVGVIVLIISLTFQFYNITISSFSLNLVIISILAIILGSVLRLTFDKNLEYESKIGPFRPS
jgi:membrane protein implicated in regulation of membrane protease activity